MSLELTLSVVVALGIVTSAVCGCVVAVSSRKPSVYVVGIAAAVLAAGLSVYLTLTAADMGWTRLPTVGAAALIAYQIFGSWYRSEEEL